MVAVSSTVSPAQRFSRRNPCPICGGTYTDERHQGRRCIGFLSSDGDYARCSREEHAGPLPYNEKDQTYSHRLTGSCRCGTEHGAGIFTPTPIRSTSTPSPAPVRRGGRIVATYDYPDPDTGELRYQVVKWEPKGFSQRRPDGNGGWIPNLEGVKRQLYRLPELRAMRCTAGWDGIVFVCEGEKDVDRLRSIGLVATCNPGGAEKWLAEYSEELRGLTPIILQDNDAPGERHVNQVARLSYGVAASVKVIELPDVPPGGDASDWLDAGGTKEELLTLAAAAPEWTPAEPTTTDARITFLEAENVRLQEQLAQRDATIIEQRGRFRALLALDRNPKIKAERSTFKAVAFELVAAVEDGHADPDGWTKIWVGHEGRAGNSGPHIGSIAEKAGVSPSTATRHINTMVRDGLVERKVEPGEPHTLVDVETGLITIDYSKPPRPARLYMRAAGDVAELIPHGAAWEPSPTPHPRKPMKGAWGGVRKKLCDLHPSAGTITRVITTEQTICANPTCGEVLDERDISPAEPDAHLARQGPVAEERVFSWSASSTYAEQDARQGAGADPETQDARQADAPEPVTLWVCETEGCGWPVSPGGGVCNGCRKRREAQSWASVQGRPEAPL